MRFCLDLLYRAALWLSAACLVAIALLVGVQVLARLLDAALKLMGREPVGIVILSLAEIAGYLLAAASFLALAGTLKAGAHIRVTLVLAALGEKRRRSLEIWVLGAAVLFCTYIAYSLSRFAYYSWLFHEVSPGLIPVPLAIPQAAMAFGMLVLVIALIDELVIVLKGAHPTFRRAEDALITGKEG
jgi:TRAP-type C4-dicarboxylate transport system permease small subunit